MRISLSLANRYALFGILLFAVSTSVLAQEDTKNQSAPAAEAGTVTGTVFDNQTGKTVRGATIAVEGTQFQAATDVDGKYVLKLPPGPYTLLVSADGYFEQPIENVEVMARKTNYIDAILVPSSISNEEIVVTADTPQTMTMKAAMLNRQVSNSISDIISAEDMSRNPDSDASAVMERMVGVTVLDSNNINIRGLDPRYSGTQVNGSMVPSTNPEKKVVSYDLFPSGLINNISAVKSFTPDQPGDFSGGLVKIETTEFPPEFILKYSAGVGFNTNVSLQDTLGYYGSHLDWIGFGAESRRLPSIFPDERITKKSAITGGGFTPEELQVFGRALKNEWEPRHYTATPDISQSITGGGTIGPIGAVVSYTYSHKNARVLEELNTYQALQGGLIPWDQFTNDKNTDTVKMGLVGNLSYKLSQNNKLLWKNFYTRDSNDETRLLDGYSSGNTADERDMRLRYVQETMWTTQASGQHYFNPFVDSLLEWRMAYSRATREEPDLRENIYRSEQGKNDYYFSTEGQSGYRQFSDQEDRIYEPGVDWSLYLIRNKYHVTFKFGGLYQKRERDFSARRFNFQVLDYYLDLQQSPERLFRSENIAPDSIQLREITRFTDTFEAGQDIYSGYAMADATFGSKWRFLGGLRYENSKIELRTFDPYRPTLEPFITKLDNSNPLPAVSIVYSPKMEMNLRGGYSRTLNRPEFREMAPFQFTDISGRSTIIGNPDLVQSNIDNFDIRWEWFPNGQDLYAVSFFSKRFDKPIERVLYWSAGLVTSFANAENATSRGIELEIKKRLGFISQRFQNFSIYSNFSRIYSNVVIQDQPGFIMTSNERPLQGQADYIFNANLEYDNPHIGTNVRILYNLVGNRITEVGTNQLPDVYLQPDHFLDFSFSHRFSGLERMQLKFTVQNILNRTIRELQGDRLYNGYRIGRSFGIGISYGLH
jgi:TonB-dependent receptor